MLLLGFLLPLVTLTVGRHVQSNHYDLLIDDDALKDIRVIGNSPEKLDLSNLSLRAVDENAFTNWNHLKTLNLSNNSLNALPKFVFANFSNLEHLDLANNALVAGNFYNGLGSLKTLNISNNPLHTFETGHFFGLPKTSRILTKGVPLSEITTGIFENPLTVVERKPLDYNKIKPLPDVPNDDDIEHSINDDSKGVSNVTIKICIKDGQLKSAGILEKGEDLPKDCRVNNLSRNTLRLDRMNIKTFQSGWYRLKDHNVKTLCLEFNEIREFTKELLNDLPTGILEVVLRGNMIERLDRGVIENNNPILKLDLSYNRISEIEDGALENLNLNNQLLLEGNRLKNTKFLDSLPSNIHDVSLAANDISEISAGNFSKFRRFNILNLNNNHITEAKSNRLCNFSSLMILSILANGLLKVEPGFFQGLTNLLAVDLSSNKLSSLEKGVFSGLEKISHIQLNINRFTKIPSDVFNELPDSLEVLLLGGNQIQSGKAGTFVNVPTMMLYLGMNRISNIEKGSFNIPSLMVLDLEFNLLKDIDGDSFEGFGDLGGLSLHSNRITTIKKGLFKNLGQLYNLELSGNSIQILENGALFGLLKDVKIAVGPVETIEGGLFDEV